MSSDIGKGWYWTCLSCGERDHAFTSEEYARAALAKHQEENGCPDE